MGEMTSAHFIYIPVALLVGLVFGWILGGRAAKDAYLVELKRREERRTKHEERRTEHRTGNAERNERTPH